jgi:hypothetical protein
LSLFGKLFLRFLARDPRLNKLPERFAFMWGRHCLASVATAYASAADVRERSLLAASQSKQRQLGVFRQVLQE